MITSYGPGNTNNFGFKEVKTSEHQVQSKTVEKKPKKASKRNKTK